MVLLQISGRMQHGFPLYGDFSFIIWNVTRFFRKQEISDLSYGVSDCIFNQFLFDVYYDLDKENSIFSNEISYEPVREMEQTEAHMYINLDVFRAMDGTYVFSRVGIINAMELGLNRVGVYQNEESPYVIYVYRMRESE